MFSVVLYSWLFKNSLAACSKRPALINFIVLGEPLKLPLNQEPTICCLTSIGRLSNLGKAVLICGSLSSISCLSKFSACLSFSVTPFLT